MRYTEKAKYPCGFEYEIEYKAGIFEFVKVNWDIEKMLCPLHGKECKKAAI